MLVGFEVLADLGKLFQKLAVELGILLGLEWFGSPHRGAHGKVFDKEGILRKHPHEVALLPKAEDLLKAGIVDL